MAQFHTLNVENNSSCMNQNKTSIGNSKIVYLQKCQNMFKISVCLEDDGLSNKYLKIIILLRGFISKAWIYNVIRIVKYTHCFAPKISKQHKKVYYGYMYVYRYLKESLEGKCPPPVHKKKNCIYLLLLLGELKNILHCYNCLMVCLLLWFL